MARTKQAARRLNNIPKKFTIKAPFQHAHLSDDELFNTPYEMLSNDVFLRLAHKYTNRDVFDRFNAKQPHAVKNVHEITSRLHNAVRVAARDSGRSVSEIREQIDVARNSNSSNTALEEAAEVEGDEDDPSAEDRKVTVTPSVRSSSALAPNLQTHILFLFVGNQREVSTIHSALFPAKTRAILEERAQQNMVQEQPIYLINDLPETFEVYRLFLYTGKVFSNNSQADQDRADNGLDEAHGDREWMRPAHLYLMGLDLDDEKFRNAILDALVEKVAETDRYPTGIATEVYNYTAQGDKLRSLVVDLHVWKGQGTGVRAPHDDASGPVEFVQDVLRGLADARSDVYDPDVQMPWEVEPCKYHVHAVTAPCKRQTAPAIKLEHTPNTMLPLPQGHGQRVLSTRKNGSHRCDMCNLTYPTPQGLGAHKKGGPHKEKTKAWAGKAAQMVES